MDRFIKDVGQRLKNDVQRELETLRQELCHEANDWECCSIHGKDAKTIHELKKEICKLIFVTAVGMMENWCVLWLYFDIFGYNILYTVFFRLTPLS